MNRILLFVALLPFLLSCLLPAAPSSEADSRPPAVLVVQVSDASGTALPGSIVGVSPGTLRIMTNQQGSASLSIAHAGQYRIRAEADNFHPHLTAAITLYAGEVTELQITLQPRTVVEEAIVVTATGRESLSSEAALRTNLISARLVDAQAKTNLAEALQATIVGVRTEMNCQNCGFVQLRMNGLEGPYTQVLEDGLPTYSGVAAVYGLEQIPAAFIEQVEVVKGGNSALYGPNAVAGVINLIRREPVENRFRLDTMTGWHGGRPEQQYGASAQLVTLPGSLSADLYYRGVQRTHIDRDRDGFTDLGRRELQSGGASVYRSFLDGLGKLSGNYTVMDEFRRGGDQFHLPPEQTYITEMANSRRHSATARWNQTLNANTYYSVRGSFANLTRHTYYGSGMDPNAYGFTDNPLWVSDGQVGRQQGEHSILGGYQISNEEVNDIAPAYNRRLGGTFRNQGLYVQDEWRVKPGLTLIGGIRADMANTVDRMILSPRAGFRLGMGERLTWRASVSTGFRAPGIFDEDLHIAQVGGEGFLIQNGAGLREERSVSYSSGLDYTARIGQRSARLGVSWFRTSLRGVFALEETTEADSGFRQLLRMNAGDAAVSGLEMDGESRLHRRLGLRGGFTWQTARFHDPEPQFGSRDFFRTPRQHGFLSADWSLPAGLEAVVTSDYTGSMRVPHYAGYIDEDRLERSRSFMVFNLVLSRTFRLGERTLLRCFANAQNVGDRYQPDLDRGPLRDSAYVYGPVEMRRVVIGATWDF
ncbi:MAG: TonB-dependent receptor [Bryobacterales bacterium]|nr:TonB-dependent receptor [Bryobacterales bacterium]